VGLCVMFEYFQIEAGKFSRGADYFEILMEYCEIVIDYFIKVVPFWKFLVAPMKTALAL